MTVTHPRQLAEWMNTIATARVPLDVTLALGLGVDVAVLSSIDLSRPVVLTALNNTAAHNGTFAWVLALEPRSASEARAILTSRYRFVNVPGLGARLDAREEPIVGTTGPRAHCALVAVTARVSSRVVCSNDNNVLTSAGRWVAFRSALATQNSSADTLNFSLSQQGTQWLGESLRDNIRQWRRQLDASIARERRRRSHGPEIADPEPVVSGLEALAVAVADGVAEARSLRATAGLDGTRVRLTTELDFARSPHTAVGRDAFTRAALPTTHPELVALPADARVLFGLRGADSSVSQSAQWLINLAVSSLGERVTDADSMRRDVGALTAQATTGVGVALSEDVPDGVELTVAIPLGDNGVMARGGLERMRTSRWLGALRMGAGRPVSSRTLPGGGVSFTTAGSARSIALAVRSGVLFVVLGRRPEVTLGAVGVQHREAEDLGGSVALRVMGRQSEELLSLRYHAHEDPDAGLATTHTAVEASVTALTALTALVAAREAVDTPRDAGVEARPSVRPDSSVGRAED